ncbi:MAG: hypothetical protein RB292_04535 [Patescibacteria group bacterium]|jgi:hypothetical protein|nr:hypothetical protein [Patescibacteria group bacterium]
MNFSSKFIKYILLLAAIGGVFLLVYSPHFSYPFPFHVDEWHHLSEALRMHDNYFDYLTMEPQRRASGLELGFHFFLFGLSWFGDLVLWYKFLPAIWAAIGAVVLFYVVYQKTQQDFLTGWLAVLFFGSIKSNVNLMGLWFFTPLTLAIPFIFLYSYFLDQGIQHKNKKQILMSLVIMAGLTLVHPISVLFFLPIAAVYGIFNYRYLISEIKFFSIFIILFFAGVGFYMAVMGVGISTVWFRLWQQIQFKSGWGVLELNNSPLELYSWIGYLLALVGIIQIIIVRKSKQFLLYLIWPLVLVGYLVFYQWQGFSILAPYQRNWYYLVISLPILSAVGLSAVIRDVVYFIRKLKAGVSWQLDKLAVVLIIVTTFGLVFFGYYHLPPKLDLYRTIDQNDYQTLLLMKTLPAGLVIAPSFISTALYPVSGHEPLGTIAFYGSRRDVEDFFAAPDCAARSQVLKDKNIDYLISPYPIDCEFGTLINQVGRNNIYQIINL